MKSFLLYCAASMALLYGIDTQAFGNKTVFGIRSQGVDGVRELAGWQQVIYKYDQDSNHGTLAIVAEYSRSVRPQEIAEFLFGGSCLTFSGSRAERAQGDILADYFGLPASFSSSVHFSPHISNTIIDFNWFQAFDAYLPGLFIMLHMPVVHTKWNLYMQEININPGTAFYPAGYMSDSDISASVLPQSVTQALRGNTVFGDMQEPLQYGKVFGRQTRSRIAELTATLGWNYNQPLYHAGISFRVGAPTGNATNAEFLFESIVGNRHHWDVGLGLSAHTIFWQNKETGRRVGLYFDAHISHLCASQQQRSFDFINGNGSRYMLLEQIETPSTGDLLINGAESINQYIGNLFPAINYTTFDTKISIGVQTDIVVKCAYQHDGFEVDFGYDFWANSKEKLHCRDRFIDNRFALKGDAQIYGFTSTNEAVPLNATQSMATILNGQEGGNSNFANANADNQPALASTPPATPLNQLTIPDANALNIPLIQVCGSNPGILLSDDDINENSGLLPRAFSQKIFIYMGNVWDNRDDLDPYFGMGLSGEFAHTNSCNNAACSQWAIWFKGGFVY